MTASAIEPAFDTNLPGLKFVGRGDSFASRSGWPSSARYAYRCARCGSVMPADSVEYFMCRCGAMFLDVDAGRFGSSLGDVNVLVYEAAT